MIVNYLKLALKVLRRNKFYTAISLFGISFTLLILMLITALYDSQLGKHAPLSEKDRMVFATQIRESLIVPDTVWTVDSLLQDGAMTYDSTMTIEENNRSDSRGGLGYFFIDQFLRDPDRIAEMTVLSSGSSFDVFLDNGKTTVEATYADAKYWRVFDFEFVSGRPFGAEEVENATSVAVVSTKMATTFFGSTDAALGQSFQLASRKFEVVGIVEKCNVVNPLVAADVYLPLTGIEGPVLESKAYSGTFEAVYLANNEADIDLIKEELADRAQKAPLQDPKVYNRQSVAPWTYGELFAANSIGGDDPAAGLQILITVFSLLLGFFVLLPTLNLINLNVSRIMERGAEIGVRKAFGAHSSNILYQFIFENIIITFIGGIIGFLLALMVIYIINDAQVIPNVTLSFNGRVFAYSLLICLGFGLLSGLLPAWRVSRFQIAETLKANQL